jgi:beta-fructofuranosidase
VQDGDTYHVFYLCASRGLGNPDRRHWYTSVGHAISTDLVKWQILPDALAPSDSPAWDSWTTWTGSVVRGDDGHWWMFYTGTSREDSGKVQRIGAARSDNLIDWQKVGDQALVEADPTLYETLQDASWPDVAWRDPWVYRDDKMWHMLITARKKNGEILERGTIGHATSSDMLNWVVDAEYCDIPSNFGQLEVFQLVEIDSQKVLVFCCATAELSDSRPEKALQLGGVYSIPVPSSLADLDLRQARLFPDTSLYAARVVHDQEGHPCLIGFRNIVNGQFIGELTDPIRVRLGDGGLEPHAQEWIED